MKNLTDITLLDGKITLGTAIGISGKQKERRNYEKIKRNKDITMFSGKKRESPKRRKTKEELLEELDMLRKEFEC